MGEHTDDIEVRATRYLSQAVQQRKGRIERLTAENQRLIHESRRLRRKLWAQTWVLVTVGAFAAVYVIVEYGPLVWR